MAVKLTGGLHLSGLKFQTEKQSATAPERCSGRRRRSTARQGDRGLPSRSVHRSAFVGGGCGCRRSPCRRRPLLRRTAVRAVVDLAGRSCGVQIEEGVSLLKAVRDYGQEQGGGGVLTEENLAGARGGRRWPESRRKGPSRLV